MSTVPRSAEHAPHRPLSLDGTGPAKCSLTLLLAIYVPTLLAIAATVVVHLLADVPIRYFFIDPVTEFNEPMYLGLYSNFGVVLWCAAATVCTFGGWLIRKDPQQRELSLFLICSGLFTGLLMFDDLYLLHEEVLPDHLFIPQMVVFGVYGALAIAYLFRFRKILLSTDTTLLVGAFVFFGLSVLVDLFVTPEEFYITETLLGRHLIEDGLKLLGIVSWTIFLTRECLHRVGRLYQPS